MHYVRRLNLVLVCVAGIAFSASAAAKPRADKPTPAKSSPTATAKKKRVVKRRATRHSEARARESKRSTTRARKNEIRLGTVYVKGRRSKPLIEAVVEKQPIRFESGTSRYAPAGSRWRRR